MPLFEAIPTKNRLTRRASSPSIASGLDVESSKRKLREFKQRGALPQLSERRPRPDRRRTRSRRFKKNQTIRPTSRPRVGRGVAAQRLPPPPWFATEGRIENEVLRRTKPTSEGLRRDVIRPPDGRHLSRVARVGENLARPPMGPAETSQGPELVWYCAPTAISIHGARLREPPGANTLPAPTNGALFTFPPLPNGPACPRGPAPGRAPLREMGVLRPLTFAIHASAVRS